MPPTDALVRALPARPGLAVPAAGAAGALLPGCECGSVPVASGVISRGVPEGVALTFLLSAPAVNPKGSSGGSSGTAAADPAGEQPDTVLVAEQVTQVPTLGNTCTY